MTIAARKRIGKKPIYLEDLGLSPEKIAESLALAEIPDDQFEQLQQDCKQADLDEGGDGALTTEGMLRLLAKRKSQSAARPKKRLMGHVPQDGLQGRKRRTKQEISDLCDGLYEIVERNKPVTCRQAFYLAETAGLVDKTEKQYKGTVCRLLAIMRRQERIPYDWVADSTRWQRKPRTYSSLESALEQTAEFYRRDLWQRQDSYVEVWCEKDALAGVLYPITSQWHVPLMVSKGFSSLTYLYEAALAINAADKPTFLYYLGDHDPSGVYIDRSIERELRRLAPDSDIHFERIAVTREQIKELKLPTRPTKKTDSRSKTFKGRSVEVDSIPPPVIRRLVDERIRQHIDSEALERLQIVECAERDVLMRVANAGFDKLADFADALDEDEEEDGDNE